VPHGEPVKILFVGGDLERKGGLVLLEAFRALRHLGLELHLVTKACLPEEPSVFVYNNLEANSQALKDLYHSCDIFALPTFGDTFAMVLSEAGASGMAIVSTRVAAIPEFVRDGETGIIVPPGDAASLTRALRDLATNPTLRIGFGERALAQVSRRYDAMVNANRLLDLLKAEASVARAIKRGATSAERDAWRRTGENGKSPPPGKGLLHGGASGKQEKTRSYEFGFVLEQSLGHVTHAENLLTNIPRDPEVHAHWSLIDFEASGVAGRFPVYKSNWTVRAGMRAYREVARMNRQTRLDALFFHTQVPAILAQRWLRKIPGIVSLDATPRQYDELGAFYRHEQGPAWLEALKWRLNRDCFRSARRLVAWSEWTKQGLVQDYDVPADKITVIPPGVNVQDWRRPMSRVPHADPVKILFVGGDLKRKGGLVLLEVFRSLRHLTLELHLVTKDYLPPEPGVFIYNNLEANSQPLKKLYHDCDIFVLPTFGDCLPMVLSEAGASGMAVISTNVAAIPEIVRNGKTGLTVPAGDPNSLSQAIRALVEESALRLTLGGQALAHVSDHYDAATNANRLLGLLKAEADAARSERLAAKRIAPGNSVHSVHEDRSVEV
jgi:glycosyltransferase involved in cell wall biosynthesis